MNTLNLMNKTLIKIPYKLHGRDYSGVDCWGLIILIYKEFLKKELIDLDKLDFGEDWYKEKNLFIENYHQQWIKVDDPQKFDIVFFRNCDDVVNHCGLFLGEDIFVQATRKHGVTFSHLNKFKNKIYGFFRLKK